MDGDREFPEVNVGDLQASEFASAHARLIKARNDGKVAVAHHLAAERILWRRGIDDGEKALTVFRCQALPRLGGSLRADFRPGIQGFDRIAETVPGTGGAAVACKPLEVSRHKADTVGTRLWRQRWNGSGRKPSKRLPARPGERQNIAGLRSLSRVRKLCGPERVREALDFPEVEPSAGCYSCLEREPVCACPSPGHCDRTNVRFDGALGAACVSEDGDGIPNRFERGSAPALDQSGNRFAAREGDDSDDFGHESLQNSQGPPTSPRTVKLVKSEIHKNVKSAVSYPANFTIST